MIAFASSLDQAGPLTRDVTDAALLFGHMVGRDPCDSTSLELPEPIRLPGAERLDGLRFGVWGFDEEGLAPEVAASCRQAVGLVEELGDSIPTLGVCLGHQAIGQAFGAQIVRGEPVHGKTARITHDGKGVYKSLDQGFEATRYHSLVIAPESVPECLVVTSRTEDGTIMGVRHREYPVEGVQFHPESVLTRSGHDLLKNFLGL
jgi:anthranilate synthase/aminodeoxychorismate synthase-like glutamine amidotransferase